MIDKFKKEISRASKKLNSDELVYETSWWFDQPSHSLKISNVELFYDYDIPSGWDGIGEKELLQLEEDGFLKKVSEVVMDQDALEKVVKYLIILEGQNKESS